MAKTRTHTWRDVNFEPKVLSTGDIQTADDLFAIRQSIISILTTKPGERVMLPNFGSNIWGLLFEEMDDITDDRLRDAVSTAIGNWEPRVNISTVKIIRDEDRNTYEVLIAYDIVGLSIAGTQSLNITLQRGS